MPIIDTLKHSFFFKNFSADQLHSISRLCRKVQMKEGQVLIESGELLTKMYIVEEGNFILTIEKNDGIHDPVAVVGNEQIIGFEGFYDPGQKSLFTATSKVASEVLEINYPQLEDLFSKNPLMAQKSLNSFQRFHTNIVKTLAGKLTDANMTKFF